MKKEKLTMKSYGLVYEVFSRFNLLDNDNCIKDLNKTVLEWLEDELNYEVSKEFIEKLLDSSF